MAHLLAKIQVGDNRNVDRLVLVDWMEVVGHLDYRDAYEAVLHHRRASTDYLTQAHVIAGARRVREARERAARLSRPAIEKKPITLDKAAWDAQVAWFTAHPGASVDDYEKAMSGAQPIRNTSHHG